MTKKNFFLNFFEMKQTLLIIFVFDVLMLEKFEINHIEQRKKKYVLVYICVYLFCAVYVSLCVCEYGPP